MRTSKLFSCVKVPPPGHCFTDVYDNYVWIYAKNFQLIFGENRLRSGKRNCLKISYGNKSIYRFIETTGYTGVDAKTIGLSYNSICDLGINQKELPSVELKVKPISAFQLMFHHPDSSQKVSFLTAIITFLVGLIIGYVV
ncbi:MAG: hypothetical protein IKK64_06410 [Bacteroidales bacterium]|nr:hypothetical protein [Bacteroidales bacterium]